MSKLVYVIAFLTFCAVAKVSSLQCYECEECDKVTDDQLITCGGTTTAAPTTSTTGQSTTAGQSTTPAQEVTPTTGQSTTAQVTTGATSDGTTVTTITSEGTTAASTTADTTTVQSTNSGATNPNENNENGESEGNYISPSRSRRTVLVQEKATEYVCLTVKLEVNSTTLVYRGCALDAGDGKVCETGIPNVTCTSCKTEKCNGAASIQVSLVLMFAAALVKIIWM